MASVKKATREKEITIRNYKGLDTKQIVYFIGVLKQNQLNIIPEWGN